MKLVTYTCDGCGKEMGASVDGLTWNKTEPPRGWYVTVVEMSGSLSITPNWFTGQKTFHTCSRECAALCVAHVPHRAPQAADPMPPKLTDANS